LVIFFCLYYADSAQKRCSSTTSIHRPSSWAGHCLTNRHRQGKAVMLTAMSMDEDRLRGLTTGADAYIVKPFNMDILRQTIVNLIQRTRTLRLKYEHTDHLEGKTPPKSVKSPDEKLLANIMKAINGHLDDDSLTMDLIASEVGLSRVHLNRKMKDLTGQTPHDFIRKVRLKKAAERLSGLFGKVGDRGVLRPLQEHRGQG